MTKREKALKAREILRRKKRKKSDVEVNRTTF